MTDNAFREKYGPVALVTGASSGIGWAFAEELAARQFDLVLTARRVDRLEDLAARLATRHATKATVCPVDLAVPQGPEQLLSATAGLDVGMIVSNAGFGMKGEHARNDPQAMTDMLMVNCHAPMQLARGYIPRLRQRGRGALVLVSSIEALIGCPYSAGYSASKALVHALGEGLWAELQPDGIEVLTVCPGATESEAAAKQGIDLAQLKNVMKAADVAKLSLDNIANGPTFFSSDHYKANFDRLLALPRRTALTAMEQAMRRSAPAG